MGSALILGTDAEGESIGCKSKLDDKKAELLFKVKLQSKMMDKDLL